jgi:N-acetylglucosamine repressor
MLSKQTTPVVAVPRKTTPQDGRRRNLQAVLQCVYQERSTSRARISRLTGLTRATVSELIGQLAQAELVVDVGVGASSGGKPPTLIELNAHGRSIVAVDLSRRPFSGAVVDLAGSIHARRTAPTRTAGDSAPAETLDDVLELVAALIDASPAPILGIGIGTPGIVDMDGVVVEAANLEWHGLDLRALLGERFDLPVTVANDAHVAALAEFGAHPGPNLVVVKIGVGIGAGIVVDGSMYRGDRPAAGEIGHIRVIEGGERCSCGNTGCLETVASVPRILRRAARSAGIDVSGEIDLRVPAELLDAREAMRESVHSAGRSLGAVLAHLVAILDIHRIIVAFELEGWEEELLESVRTEVATRVLPDLAEVVELHSSSSGSDLVITGAAALVLREELGVVW